MYWQKKLLEDGKHIVEDIIRQMQTDLYKIEYSLKCQEEQDIYSECNGIYQRKIDSRYFIIEEYFEKLENISQFGCLSTRLIEYAESKDFSVVLPTGFMYTFNENKVRQFLFYEVLPTNTEDKKVIQIPKGSYSCLQIEFDPDRNHIQFLEQHFGSSDKRIAIVSNLIRDKIQIDCRYNEIQVIDGYTIPDRKD